MVIWYFQVLNSLGVANILSFIALFILAIYDIKTGEIRYPYLLMIVDFSFLSAYILLILIIIFYKYVEEYIGGADLLIFALLVSRYNYYDTFLIFFYASIIALFYAIILNKKEVRFIPFIFISFFIYLKGVL